ncbi:MAG TPA: hypothetical protein VFS02_07560 [Telluria sp.]|nr:hypothetical protein [Telluria sp.]
MALSIQRRAIVKRPIGVKARDAVCYLLGCLVLALLLAALVRSTTGAGWIDSVLFSVPLLMLYALVCGVCAYFLCRAWPRLGKASIAAVFCISAGMASAGWAGLGNAWNALLHSGGRGIPMDTTLKASMFVLGVVFYGLTVLGNYFVIALRARRRSRASLF